MKNTQCKYDPLLAPIWNPLPCGARALRCGIHPGVAEWHTPDLAPQCCAHPVWHPMWLSSYVAECDQIEPAFARLGATKNQDEMATVENALNKISGWRPWHRNRSRLNLFRAN